MSLLNLVQHFRFQIVVIAFAEFAIIAGAAKARKLEAASGQQVVAVRDGSFFDRGDCLGETIVTGCGRCCGLC